MQMYLEVYQVRQTVKRSPTTEQAGSVDHWLHGRGIWHGRACVLLPLVCQALVGKESLVHGGSGTMHTSMLYRRIRHISTEQYETDLVASYAC